VISDCTCESSVYNDCAANITCAENPTCSCARGYTGADCKQGKFFPVFAFDSPTNVAQGVPYLNPAKRLFVKLLTTIQYGSMIKRYKSVPTAL
jgi:hypothetical protein